MAQVSKEEAVLGEVVGIGDVVSTLPLSHTDVQGQIVGLQATISLVQQFANPFRTTIEVAYRFAIPRRAALVGFEIRVGSRTIAGEIAERAEAEVAYRAAVAEGRRAALATEERPNLYTVQIGQIHPGETVFATYRYSLPVDLDGGEFSLVLPFGITPRYHSPQENPRDAARTSVVTAPPGVPIGDLDITLAIDAGLPIADPVSSSHHVAVTRSDERRCLVRLVEPRWPNQDFVLRYPAGESKAIGSRAWWTRSEWGNLLYAIFVPPPPDQTAEPEPREYVFVLDRSGSMSGQPIAQARNALRACLRLLGQNDTFRLLTFDNVVEWYEPSREEPQGFSRETLRGADAFLTHVEGRGGTEIVGALQEVARCPRDPKRRRVVVLFTDGAVSAEDQAARLVAERLNGDRLFCFGIGPAVNRYLLDQLSRAGRGVAEVVGLDEDIEGAIIRFQDRLSYPVLSDLTLTLDSAPVPDFLPSPLPDLYAGAALQVVARLGATDNPRLRLSGKRGSEKVTMTVEAMLTDEPLVARYWARQRLDQLLEAPNAAAANREAIIALSRSSGIITPLTALLAVDRVAGDPVPSRRVVVATPLPPGLDYNGFAPPMSMAAASPMFDRSANAMSSAPPRAPRPPSGPGKALRKLFSSPSHETQDARAAKSNAPSPAGASAPPPTDALSDAVSRDANDLVSLLRALLREQNADGSWGNAVDATAAALVAFARAGETSTRGSYRRALDRARRWLDAHARAPEDLLFRAWALAEMRTPLPASEANSLLPASSSPLAAALHARLANLSASGSAVKSASADYRVAAVSAGGYSGRLAELDLTWMACIRAGDQI